MSIDKETLASDPLTVKQLEDAQKRYLAAYKKANYTHFSNTELNQIFRFGAFDKAGDPVFFVFGVNQSYQSQRMQRLYLLMIRWFQQQFRNLMRNQTKPLRFSIVYFNNQCATYMQYIAFRGIYRSLPKKYFDNLKRIIVVNPGIAVKTLEWITLGTINKYLRALTTYVDTVNQLEEHGILLTKESLNIIPESMKIESSQGQKKTLAMCNNICQSVSHETLVDNRRKKIFMKQLASDKNIAYQYNEPKQKASDLLKRKLESYEMCDIQIPLILKLLISYLHMRPDSLNQQGIFRRSVSIDDEEEAIIQIHKKNYDFLEKIQNPHIVANLIKKFLVNLIEPIIPYTLYNKFIYNVSEGDIDLKYVASLLKQLPKINYITLQFVISFFKDEVVPKQATNKMTTYNISVVLCPCLFRSQTASMNDLVYGKKLAIILEKIINNFDFVFGTKKQQLERLRESSHIVQLQFERTLIEREEQKQQKKVEQLPKNVIKQQQINSANHQTVATKQPTIPTPRTTNDLPLPSPNKLQQSRPKTISEQLFLSQEKSEKVQNPYDSLALSSSITSFSSKQI